MCGIVGYLGTNRAQKYLIHGLETLEYRGYDSAGIAVIENDQMLTSRYVGRVEQLKKGAAKDIPTPAGIGIGHTRWATHGKVLQKNAHPHLSNNKAFSVVHNGIIENHEEIRAKLIKAGYEFHSNTDTEVVPNLISFHYSTTNDVEEAFKKAVGELSGAYAIVMISTHKPDAVYAAKLSSPLAIGVGKDELFIGSDALPLADYADEIVFLEDGEIAILQNSTYAISEISSGKGIDRSTEKIELDTETATLGDYEDFMIKEIHEAAATVRSAMLGRLLPEEGYVRLGGLNTVKNQLSYVDRIIILACGTSLYAGMVGEYLIEEIAGIPVEVQQASEFRYRKEPLNRSTAVLVVSQSGETADTIAALKKLEGTGILKLGIVNAPGSTLTRMTDAGVLCHAGPEKAVASTKAFVAQVTVFILVALYLSKNYEHYTKLIEELDELPSKIDDLMKQKPAIKSLAEKYSHHRDFLYIGRRYAYPVALEGALKLKEISYIHAEAFAGGEMKHGPLALIDKNFPTFAIALTNDLEEKSLSNMQEIHARDGKIIAVIDNEKSPANDVSDDRILIPAVSEPLQPILSAIATHLFAYYAAKELCKDVDKPRNLAKSVTVE